MPLVKCEKDGLGSLLDAPVYYGPGTFILIVASAAWQWWVLRRLVTDVDPLVYRRPCSGQSLN